MAISRPTTLDAIVAAHMLLLLEPPYPAPVIRQLLVDSYPTLVTHARLMFSPTLGATAPAIPKTAAQKLTWKDMLPPSAWSRKRNAKSEDEIRYDRVRWSFYGVALGCMVAFTAVVVDRARLQELLG